MFRPSGLFLFFALPLCPLAMVRAAPLLLQENPTSLAFEAEDYTTLSSSSYQVITQSSGSNVLPAGTNAAGSALYIHSGAGNTYATYNLSFTADGIYYLYGRYSMYDRTDPSSYGNEDSYYTPPAFNLTADSNDITDTQHLNLQGANPTTNPNEGLYFYWDEANTEGTSTPRTFTIAGASTLAPVAVTFSIRSRENGVALDRFAFITTRQTITAGDSVTLNSLASAPEPSGVLLLGSGMMVIFGRRRRV